MTKETFCYSASALLLIAGIGFGIAGFCVAPVGEVSDSVLLLVAQCFVMAGSFLGLDAMLLSAVKKIKKNQQNNEKED